MSLVVFTVGHSNRSLETLLHLLRTHAVNVVADVRSQPFSKLYPQFNRASLDAALHATDIKYLFLGNELGARSSDPSCYAEGRVRYDRLAGTPLFQHGLERVLAGAARGFRIALLCAEKEPLHCHRSILIARHLQERGARVQHIIDENTLESHEHAVERLLQQLAMGSMHLFKTTEELQAMAYESQAEKIAFTRNEEEAERS